MHLAILANDLHSFNRTIAHGLARMALACGATAEVYPEGLRVLEAPVSLDFTTVRSAVGSGIHLMRNRRMLDRLVDNVSEADVIVVVAHVPISFARGALRNIEVLRARLPGIPIVNYAHYYLPTMDKWSDAVLRGVNNGLTEKDMSNLRRGAFRMNRYDWYLVASVTSEIPLPPGPQPYSRVGVNIDDGSLFPEQNGEFRGLVDFAQTRMNYPSFRKTQIAALERAGVPYRVLEGQFSRAEIREIYRRTGAFFLAHRESFGLPICELQACGSWIFTPRAEWAGAHWIKEDLRAPGPGSLSPNFCVYDDDPGKLAEKLLELRESFDPARNRRTFEEFHPHLLRGDRDGLADFMSKVEDGTINSRSHLQYENLGV